MGDPRQQGGPGRAVRELANLGFEIALPVVLFMFAGRWLDGRFGTDPWLMLAGALLGMAVGFYILFRKVASASRGGDDDSGSGSNG